MARERKQSQKFVIAGVVSKKLYDAVGKFAKGKKTTVGEVIRHALAREVGLPGEATAIKTRKPATGAPKKVAKKAPKRPVAAKKAASKPVKPAASKKPAAPKKAAKKSAKTVAA